MIDLHIYCDQDVFTRLQPAFEGEVQSDCPLAAEILLVSPEEIRTLNREQRNIDAVTDVLSFPTLEGEAGRALKAADYPYDIDEEGNLFLGSIVICTQRAREQAEEFGHGYERELYYLAVHGMFHLLGYDHMTEEDKRAMRAREERVMEKLQLTRE